MIPHSRSQSFDPFGQRRGSPPLTKRIEALGTRMGNHLKLCSNIKKNPGPSVYVDATKTIHAQYCQGNVTVFRENAGQECVAMSLCAFKFTVR